MQTGRAASADGSLTVITVGRGLERAEGLRFTNRADRSLIVRRDLHYPTLTDLLAYYEKDEYLPDNDLYRTVW